MRHAPHCVRAARFLMSMPSCRCTLRRCTRTEFLSGMIIPRSAQTRSGVRQRLDIKCHEGGVYLEDAYIHTTAALYRMCFALIRF